MRAAVGCHVTAGVAQCFGVRAPPAIEPAAVRAPVTQIEVGRGGVCALAADQSVHCSPGAGGQALERLASGRAVTQIALGQFERDPSCLLADGRVSCTDASECRARVDIPRAWQLDAR